jgi:putative stress-induced transcription regulator/CGNR zinc finger protein
LTVIFRKSMSRAPFLFLEGNPPWLDFVNTELILGGTRVDLLTGPRALRSWLKARGFPPPPGRIGRPVFRRAIALRTTLRRAAMACGARGFPPAAARTLNGLLAGDPGTYRLTATRKGWTLRFEPGSRKAVSVLVPLARSTAEFVASADLSRVRTCANPACILTYYDTSKNRARRWCSMALCGNRRKVAEFYRRRRGGLGRRDVP